MEEDKAAAYYEELLRKGGGAARFKQGLGYSTQSSDRLADSDSNPSFCNLLKGGSPRNSYAAIEKETRLATVRDKLKKRHEASDEHDVKQGIGERSYLRLLTERKTLSPERDYKYLGSRSRGSHVQDSSHSAKRHSSFNVKRKRKHRHKSNKSRSGSPYSGDYRASSYSSSGQSYDTRDRTRSRKSRRRSQSCSSLENKGISCLDSRAQESSISSADRRARRKRGTPRARRRSHSGGRNVKQSSRKPSRSSSANSSEDQHRLHGVATQRCSNQTHRSRSPHRGQKKKSEYRREAKPRGRLREKKATKYDYSKIFPGFELMTPAEKVKATMKLQLSETVVKDSAKGMSGEWERFDFNKEAPLDDDAKLDYFGDGTGERDDTGFLQNTGSTFVSSNQQARREAQVKESHDAAIFGAPTDVPSGGKQIVPNRGDYLSFSMEAPDRDTDIGVQAELTPQGNNLLSDQVLEMQRRSWRERALKLKEQRAARKEGD